MGRSEAHHFGLKERILGWTIPTLLVASGTAAAAKRIDAAQAYVNTAPIEVVLTPEQIFNKYIGESRKKIMDCETDLCPINDKGHVLKKHAALAFVDAQKAAGKRIELTGPLSANRTKSQQQSLYDCFKNKVPGCYPAFPPDHPRANHLDGEAIDVSNWRVPNIVESLSESGWIRPYNIEPWHFEKRRS